MVAKKENTANSSNNTVTVEEETDFTDNQHGGIANYCNDYKVTVFLILVILIQFLKVQSSMIWQHVLWQNT